jgi:hypothetical protein
LKSLRGEAVQIVDDERLHDQKHELHTNFSQIPAPLSPCKEIVRKWFRGTVFFSSYYLFVSGMTKAPETMWPRKVVLRVRLCNSLTNEKLTLKITYRNGTNHISRSVLGDFDGLWGISVWARGDDATFRRSSDAYKAQEYSTQDHPQSSDDLWSAAVFFGKKKVSK